MKKFLLAFCVVAITAANAQSNLEKEIVGTWAVVEVGSLEIPPGDLEPSKIEEMKQALRTAKFEFREDHHFQMQSDHQQLNMGEGYWVVKGNQVAVGDWAHRGKVLGWIEMTVRQRDDRWFFVVKEVGELEVRKD